MPVWKFRSLDEARRALLARPPDVDLATRIRRLFDLTERLAPPRQIPRGVRKYRSIEEANSDRARWSRAAERAGSDPAER